MKSLSKLTIRSAKSFSIHRVCPEGGSEQAVAIKNASLKPSSFRGLGCF
ncbi:hypothetical protein [Nostoc sp.]